MFWFPLHWLGGQGQKKNGAGIALENQSPDELQMLAYATKPNTQFPTELEAAQPVETLPKPSRRLLFAKAAATALVLGSLGTMQATQRRDLMEMERKTALQEKLTIELKEELERTREEIAAQEKKKMEIQP